MLKLSRLIFFACLVFWIVLFFLLQMFTKENERVSALSETMHVSLSLKQVNTRINEELLQLVSRFKDDPAVLIDLTLQVRQSLSSLKKTITQIPAPDSKDLLNAFKEVEQGFDGRIKDLQQFFNKSENLQNDTMENKDLFLFVDRFINSAEQSRINAIISLIEEKQMKYQQLSNTVGYVLVLFSVAMVLACIVLFVIWQKQREKSQRLADLFKDAVNSVGEGFAFCDEKFNLVFWNDQFEDLHGPIAKHLKKGMKWHEYVQLVRETKFHVREEQQPDGNTLSLTSHGRWILSSSHDMAQGGYSYICVDLTAQKHHEERLKMSSIVFNTASEAMMVTNPDNVIEMVNPSFSRITGYSPEETIGKDPSILSSGLHGSRFYRDMYESLQKSGMWQGEIWNKRKNGEFYPEWLAITTIYDNEGQVSKRLAMFSDISSRKKSEERIHYQANYDALTDLPNRNLFQERLRQSINMAKRAEKRVAVIMLDIDNFKHINDTLGHVLGDNLLCQVGERLTSLLRTSDTIARLSGDEFMIIINDVPHNADVEHKLDQILECLSLPYVLEGNTAYASASVGVTFYPDDGLTVDSLFQNADAAMFQAKKKGRNTYSFFTAEMNTQAQERHQMEVDLHRALDQHEFEMHYQPIVEPVTHKLVKAEALIRWNDPEKGLISPGKFIPVAEETGLIVPMGEWILRQSCKDCAQWYHETGREIGVSVNLSSQQFKRTDVYALVVEVLEETKLPAHMLSLEMTESILVDDDRDILTLLQKLRKLGVMLSIDDFGTGYSSLSYLKKFPITTLKIDRAFVSDVLENEEDAALCMAILSMAQSLKLRVIAEGVELEGQVDFLRERNCNLIQGFFYSKPLKIADFRGYMDGDDDQNDQVQLGV